MDGRDDAGALAGALASGVGEQTLEALVESRPVTVQSREPFGRALVAGPAAVGAVIGTPRSGLGGDQWGYLDQSRQATWWRSWHLITAWMVTTVSGVTRWQASQWPACIEVMTERRRQRKLQTLPAAVQSLLLLAGKTANTLSMELLAV